MQSPSREEIIKSASPEYELRTEFHPVEQNKHMWTIERITPAAFEIYREIRLRALQESPTAFGSLYSAEVTVHDAEWKRRAERCCAERHIGLLAMDAKLACGIVRATPDTEHPQIVWLESMWVSPESRRKGLGRLLVNKILTWAGQNEMHAVKLSVTENNRPALGLYTSLGFVATGRTEPFPHDPRLTELEMVALL